MVVQLIVKIIIICAVALFLIAYFHFTQVGVAFDKVVQIRNTVQNATDPIVKNILQRTADYNLTRH